MKLASYKIFHDFLDLPTTYCFVLVSIGDLLAVPGVLLTAEQAGLQAHLLFSMLDEKNKMITSALKTSIQVI